MSHASHCCIIHGCKYGEYDTCDVCLGKVKQEHFCEYCYDFIYEELESATEIRSNINKQFLKKNRLYKLKQISRNNDDRRDI